MESNKNIEFYESLESLVSSMRGLIVNYIEEHNGEILKCGKLYLPLFSDKEGEEPVINVLSVGSGTYYDAKTEVFIWVGSNKYRIKLVFNPEKTNSQVLEISRVLDEFA